MSLKNEMYEWALSKVGHGYILGAQGQTMQDIIQYYAKQRLGQSADSIKEWLDEQRLNREFYDCSGLIVAYLLKAGLIKKDYSADMIMKELAAPTETPEAGDVGFLLAKDGKAYHVGVVGKLGKMIHACSSAKGVIIEGMEKREWKFYSLPCLGKGSELSEGQEVTLDSSVHIYNTAAEAAARRNAVGIYYEGNYTVYKIYGSGVNITRSAGIPGGWVNREDIK